MTRLPDTKLALCTWLTAQLTGATVSGGVPDDLPASLPLVALFRPPSGPPVMFARWDKATINVQVWAATEISAFDTAMAAYDLVHDTPGTTIGDVVIASVTDTTGIGSVPDPGYPDYYRYMFTVAVKARNA